MATFTALLLVFSLVGERLTIQFDRENVDRIVRVIETHAGAKVEVATEYRGRKVSVQAENQTVPDVLEKIAVALGGASKKLGPDRFRIAPKWQHAILEKLEKNRVHGLTMEDAELGQALRLFHTQCGVRVHSTVDAKRKISFKADDVSYRTLLDTIAKAAGGSWQLRYGVAYLAEQEQLKGLPVRPPAIRKAPTIPLLLKGKTMREALTYLQAVTGRKFKWPKELPATRITVHVNSLALDHALALVLYPAGLTAAEKDDVIVVTKRK
ncbi:MAG: hypothetical protein ACYS0F_14740 [Planctomycetota bacterium]|jgi:hypothetical protein